MLISYLFKKYESVSQLEILSLHIELTFFNRLFYGLGIDDTWTDGC